MASHIRFDPPNAGGLVASGTTVASAAERLGVAVELACGGRGECTSCAVEVLENPFSLSDLTDAERRMLTPEQIGASVRLACQARLGDGECVVRVLEPAGRPEGAAGEARAEGGEPRADGSQEEEGEAGRAKEQIRQAFSSLPAGEQISTALELQLKVAGDLLGAVVETPLRVGEQIIESIFGARPTGEAPEGDAPQPAAPRIEDETTGNKKEEGPGSPGSPETHG